MLEIKPIQAADQKNRHFILHVSLTQGKDHTIDEIRASSRQVVTVPTTYLEMIQQL